MPSHHHRNRSTVFRVLLITWLFCSSSIVNGQPPAPENVEPAYQQPSLRKLTFKHAKAADVLKIFQQISGGDLDGVAVDERTNSLIYLANDEDASETEALYTLLDAETPVTPDPSTGLSVSIPALGPQPQVFSFSIGFERGESIESLKKQYNELEQQAHLLADKLKKQSTSLSEAQRTELQLAVRKSFEARQSLQRAELAELARRLQNMQKSIALRDELADKVIERRVEDLLNPNLKWETGQFSRQQLAGPNEGLYSSAMQLPKSPAALPASVPYVPGEQPSTVIGRKIQGRWIVDLCSNGNKDGLADLAGPMEVEIDGNTLRYKAGKDYMTGPIFLVDCTDPWSQLTEDGPYPINFIYDPNGDPQTLRGIIACDGATLSICTASDSASSNDHFRPTLFVPGSKVTLLKCRRAEPEAVNASSVDHAPPQSSVQLATSKLLSAYRVSPNIDPNEAPKVIALVDVDYHGNLEAGKLREEIYEWIASNIPVGSPGKFTLLSRKLVNSAMIETGLRPGDLARSNPSYLENRQRILEQCRRHDVKLDSLLITSLKHLGDSDDAKQNQFELTLEGFIDARTSWFERVVVNGKVEGQFDELLNEAQPTTESPKASTTEKSNSKTIARKYSVGSFVTECFFTGKSSYDTKEVYDKYETEIEQSLQDLAKTVTATCTQPPKFVQVLRSSRCLLIGHSEAGHEEIASFMSDIDVNNDRIRLRGESVIITSAEAKTLGIDLTKPVLLAEEVAKLREFQQANRKAIEDRANKIPFDAMDETIQSGARTNLKSSEIGLQFPIAARIVPGTKELQIRLDFEGETSGVHYYAPRFQTLSDGQAALFGFGECYLIATAAIVRDEVIAAIRAY